MSKFSDSDDEDVARQISGLERMLGERGGELTRALSDLKESEHIGRELVRELEAIRLAPSASPAEGRRPPTGPSGSAADSTELAELRTKLDRLAALNAEREADLTAARWTIDKLEARIAETGEAVTIVRPPPIPARATPCGMSSSGSSPWRRPSCSGRPR